MFHSLVGTISSSKRIDVRVVLALSNHVRMMDSKRAYFLYLAGTRMTYSSRPSSMNLFSSGSHIRTSVALYLETMRLLVVSMKLKHTHPHQSAETVCTTYVKCQTKKQATVSICVKEKNKKENHV